MKSPLTRSLLLTNTDDLNGDSITYPRFIGMTTKKSIIDI
jgi:hypothetical protein